MRGDVTRAEGLCEALAAGVSRTICMATVWALGDSGPDPTDESLRCGGR